MNSMRKSQINFTLGLVKASIFAVNHVYHGQQQRFNHQIQAQIVGYNWRVYYP